MKNHHTIDQIDIKKIELEFSKELIRIGTVNKNTDIRLIPSADGANYILFIEKNNVTKIDLSISIRVNLSISIDGTYIVRFSDNRVTHTQRNNIIFKWNESHSESFNNFTKDFDTFLSDFGGYFPTFRIRINNTSLFLSGYNDYIDDNLERVKFPMFSERKYKLYASIENAENTIEVIKKQHPKLNVSWI